MPLVIRKGSQGVSRRMRLIEKKVQNPPPTLWVRVGAIVSKNINRQFVTEGSWFGTPWLPLKPRYRLWKMAHGYSRKTLVASGEMRSSFTSRPMSIEIYSGKEARFGSRNQKAIWHHNGTHRHGKRINPPRKIMGNNPEMQREIADVVRTYVFGRGAKV